MNCPPLVKEITDLLLPSYARAQSFRTFPAGRVSMDTRTDAVHLTTGLRFNTHEPGAGTSNGEGAMHSARPGPKDSWSNLSFVSPLLIPSNRATHHTTIDGYTFNRVQPLPLDYDCANSLNLTKCQGIHGTGLAISDGRCTYNGAPGGNPKMLIIGIQLNSNVLTSNSTTIGDGLVFLSLGVLIGDGVLIGPEAINL
jgi:hypothetical protein